MSMEIFRSPLRIRGHSVATFFLLAFLPAIVVVSCGKNSGEDNNLLEGAAKNKLEEVRQMLANGANPNVHLYKNGNTPLHRTTSPEIAKLLIRKDADVDSKNQAGNTPLHIAAYTGNKALAEVLLENGASVGSRNGLGATPLHFAATFTPVDGYSYNGIEDQHDFVWHHGVGKRIEVARLLLDNGAERAVYTDEGETPLDRAMDFSRGDPVGDSKQLIQLLNPNSK